MKDIRVVVHNVVGLYAEPRRSSELVSQVLMGAIVRVLKSENAWSYIEAEDTYRGWAEDRWIGPVSDEPLSILTPIFSEMRAEPDSSSPLVARLSIMVKVIAQPTTDKFSNATLLNGMSGFIPTDSLRALPVLPPTEIPTAAAQRCTDFLGTPYLWGGSSSFGIDCSGLMQMSYRLAGLLLRRDADIQRSDERFIPVSPDDFVPGDLVFFGPNTEKITHVGMYLKDGTFIHSAGGAGVIISPVGDDRYWPNFIDARRLDPSRASDPLVRFEADDR